MNLNDLSAYKLKRRAKHITLDMLKFQECLIYADATLSSVYSLSIGLHVCEFIHTKIETPQPQRVYYYRGLWSRYGSYSQVMTMTDMTEMTGVLSFDEHSYTADTERELAGIALSCLNSFRDRVNLTELEAIIKLNSSVIYQYCYHSKGQWIEAEDIIATNAITSVLYAIQVLGTRFPKAEEKIFAELSEDDYKYKKYVELPDISISRY